jgi:4-amino-4-deoxy-L-arabinose transferase-like glycosyltransferase
MTRKVVGWGAEALGLAGFGLLHLLALQDDRRFIIALMDRATGLALCLTVVAIGALLLSGPQERRAVPFIILATLVVGAILLSPELGVFGFWVVPAAVASAALAGAAALLVGETKRQRYSLRVLVGVGMTVVLFLAVVALVTVHDLQFF